MPNFHTTLTDKAVTLNLLKKEMASGICHGITMRWLEACLLNEESGFTARIKKLLSSDAEDFLENFEQAKEKIKRHESLSEEEQALFDMHAFFDSLMLYQRPFDHEDVFNKYLNPFDVEATSQIAASDAIFLQGGLKCIGLSPQICTQAEIATLLEQVAGALEAQPSSEPITIGLILVGVNHAIGLTYQTGTGLWSAMDINQGLFVPTTDAEEIAEKLCLSVATKNTEGIAEILYKGLFDTCPADAPYVAFHTSVVTTSEQIEKLPGLASALTTIGGKITPEIVGRGSNGTLAFVSAKCGCADTIQVLAKSGARLDIPVGRGDTPAFTAARDGYADVIVALANAGTSLDTFLAHIAAENGHADVIVALANAGGDLNKQRHGDGASPANIAAKKGHADVIAALAKAGADLNAAMSNGITSMFIAAKNGHADVIKLLPFNDSPYKASAESLRAFAKAYDAAVQTRMEEIIANSKTSPVPVTPEQIAYVMGHEEVVCILQEKKRQRERAAAASGEGGSSDLERMSPTLSKAGLKKHGVFSTGGGAAAAGGSVTTGIKKSQVQLYH